MSHSGLFVAPDTSGIGTSPTDGRLALAGVLGTNARPIAGGGISQSSSNMQITVAAGVWMAPDPANSAAPFLTATDATVVTPSPGPASGSRIDSIVLKQNNPENGDSDARSNITLIAGTAASVPTPPSVGGQYLEIARITVPTGVSSATACTVDSRYGARLSGLPLTAASPAALASVAGSAGQIAYVGSAQYLCFGGGDWRPWNSSWINFNSTDNFDPGTGSSRVYGYRFENGDLHVKGAITFGSTPTTSSNSMVLQLPTPTFNGEFARAQSLTLIKAGVAKHLGSVELTDTSHFQLLWNNVAVTPAGLAPISATTPFALAAGDGLVFDFAYSPA